ncbi:MAG: FAD-binding protein [Clostridiales bacterium]|nr:FAD-binding protein [Clostridiales bacterium]
MKRTEIRVAGLCLPVYSLNTLIIGSGAAALKAAVSLHQLGVSDIAIATDDWSGGTSRNAGSDKQTYYKLSLAGELSDSVVEMARDLCAGGSMHGDIALVEAANSLRVFFHLVELGVPFPHDGYGAYAGYKTDNDPRQRATSAGPLTSRLMCEALGREVRERKIPVFNKYEVIALLTRGIGKTKKIAGAIALDRKKLRAPSLGFVLFNAVNVVLGTGGPAGMYRESVYPTSQLGSHGMAFEAGAAAQNLTESQFGLASTKFRWNLSGTYQQVIPRYISTDRNGRDERQFLNEVFPDMGKLATAIFLKGYEWPFDPRKISGYGSSLIDLLVYRETVVRGRRVFLDFRRDPSGGGKLKDFSSGLLSKEAYTYLAKSKALLGTPIKRLARMNPLAIAVYKDNGIDLAKEPLEIALCAQHNNGGLKGNIWWESNLKHLFPVGEVNGSHGVRRPGGSALNSGQVGGWRAALFIARHYNRKPPALRDFLFQVRSTIEEKIAFAQKIIDPSLKDSSFLTRTRQEIQERMSAWGAAILRPEKVSHAVAEARTLLKKLQAEMRIRSAKELPAAFKNLDLCLTHALYLEAIREYIARGGKSRGSFLILEEKGRESCPGMGKEWRFSLNPPGSFVDRKILEISLGEKMRVIKKWVDVRPIPHKEGWFEQIWEDYRKGRAFEHPEENEP